MNHQEPVTGQGKSHLIACLICSLLVFLKTATLTPHILASPINLPTEHWSYHFIERLQAKGILGDFLSNTKPYSRDEVARMAVHVSDLLEKGEISLSSVEHHQLEILKRELAQELIELGFDGIDEYRYLLNWSDGRKRLITEVGYTQDAVFKRGTEDYRNFKSTLQVVLRGNLEGGFFFYNESRASYEKSEEPLPLWHPFIDITRYPWSASSDAYVIFRLPWTDLQIGKDEVLLGPGYHGVVGLSGVNPTFDIIRFPVKIWKAKFVSMMGFLRDELTKELGSSIVRKYLFAHRVEIKPFTGVCIGWQEVYIYDKLHIELVNPVMPYQMAEDYLGQVGNNTMEGDIDLCILPNTRLYASLFLDDFHPKESLFTYTYNTWAMLGGVFVADPFGIDNIDIRAEYTRVEPWVYSHKGIIDDPPIPTSYKHFDVPLGHWIGSNADDLFFEINHQLSGDLKTTLSYSRIRKGEIGGSLYAYPRRSKKQFLEGIVEKTQTVSLGLKYRIYQDSVIELSYSHARVNNKQREEAKLPESDDRKQPWKAGHNWFQNVVKASITLKY